MGMATKEQEQDMKVQKGLNGNGRSIVSTLKSRMTKIKPEKFGWDDVAQQIIGACLFSAPFAVTEEVWKLALNLSLLRTIFIVLVTVFV